MVSGLDAILPPGNPIPEGPLAGWPSLAVLPGILAVIVVLRHEPRPHAKQDIAKLPGVGRAKAAKLPAEGSRDGRSARGRRNAGSEGQRRGDRAPLAEAYRFPLRHSFDSAGEVVLSTTVRSSRIANTPASVAIVLMSAPVPPSVQAAMAESWPCSRERGSCDRYPSWTRSPCAARRPDLHAPWTGSGPVRATVHAVAKRWS